MGNGRLSGEDRHNIIKSLAGLLVNSLGDRENDQLVRILNRMIGIKTARDDPQASSLAQISKRRLFKGE